MAPITASRCSRDRLLNIDDADMAPSISTRVPGPLGKLGASKSSSTCSAQMATPFLRAVAARAAAAPTGTAPIASTCARSASISACMSAASAIAATLRAAGPAAVSMAQLLLCAASAQLQRGRCRLQ